MRNSKGTPHTVTRRPTTTYLFTFEKGEEDKAAP